MNYYLLCVVILTIIFSIAGVTVIIFLRSASRTLKNFDSMMENVRQTAAQADKVIGESEGILLTLNGDLPELMKDLRKTAANAKSISDNAERRLSKGLIASTGELSLAGVAGLGTVLLKGVSVLRKFKKKRVSL